MIVAVVLVLIAAGATLPVARRGSAVKPLMAAHFPGQPTWVGPNPPVSLRVWVIAAGIALIAAIGGSLVAPVLGIVLAVLGASTLIVLAGLLHRYARGCAEVRSAVKAYAPRIAMPYTGRAGLHIGMWSPWIDRTGVPWCIVVRSAVLFDKIAAMYDIPIVLGRLPPTVRGALYSFGGIKNAKYLKKASVTHVFLGHGDSDKARSASDRVLKYDVVAVAGQAAVDRFVSADVHVPADQLRIIGRPQIEGIVATDDPLPHPATVLYAPTWRRNVDADNFSSLAVADRIVQSLLDRGCTVVFRRHFAGQSRDEAGSMIVRVNELLAADAATTGRPHRWGTAAMREPLVDAFNSVDLMVSDVSGVVVDFMATGKPLLMYAAHATDPESFRAAHPTARSAYFIDRDLRLLEGALDCALGDDPLAPVRAERADHYLGGSERSDPARRFMALVVELAEPHTVKGP